MTVALIESPFQLGYVTNDLDQAIGVMRDRFGVGEFVILPDTGGDQDPRIAIAYSGTMMFELIQPRTTGGDLYSDWIPPDDAFVLRHHHLGMLVDGREELASIRDRHTGQDTRIASEGDTPGFVAFLYADTTASLGHYLEYIVADEGVRDLFASVPGRTFTTQ